MGIESFLAEGLTSASTSGISLFFPILAMTFAFFRYKGMDEAPPIDMPSEMLLSSYHFIVIGGGSAGTYSKLSLFYGANAIRDTNSSIFFLSFLLFAFSSGAVVANRLSEIEDWNILLLEAGGDETEISDVPLLTGYLQLSQLMNW